MMNLLSVVQARLEQTCNPPFKLIDHAAKLDPEIPPKVTPSAFLALFSESAEVVRRAAVGPTRQNLTSRFGVFIFQRRYGDVAGGKKMDDLSTLRGPLRTALLGWAPSDKHLPVVFVEGNLYQMDKDGIWWLDEFETSILISS